MRGEVYKIIKKEGGATLDRIAKEFPPTERAHLLDVLEREVKRGRLLKEGDTYHIRNFLMPPVVKPAKGIAWDYDTIQKGLPPNEFMNQWNSVVADRQQGDRGTCVGQSTAGLKDYLYIAITGDKFTGSIVRNIVEGTAIYDKLYDQSFSAECIYRYSREEANLTGPDGSYCNAAIRALYKRGICLEKNWRTSKTSRGVWATPYPGAINVCEWEAAQHKIDGYAALFTLASVKQALATHGVAVGAINIYENYMDNGTVTEDGVSVFDGNLPDPRGETVGSHALCFVGYSDIQRKLYFRHSWPGWSKLGSISYTYFDLAGGDFWVALDANEAIVGKELYHTIEISVTPQEASDCAVLTINGVQRTEKLPARIAFEKGTTVTIVVTAPGYKSQTMKLDPVNDSVNMIQFTLEAGTDPEPEPTPVPLWERFIDWVMGIINRIFRR